MHEKIISRGYAKAFTVVELLIVIVVIAILAAISVVAYTGMQQRAREAKISSDLSQLNKAVILARESSGSVLGVLTSAFYTSSSCTTLSPDTDIAALSRSDFCWSAYIRTLDRISEASGVDVRNLVDPWGRPYHIDENEGEYPDERCREDRLGILAYPQRISGGGSRLAVEHRIMVQNYLPDC